MKSWLGPTAIVGAALLLGVGSPAFGQNPLSDFSRAIRTLTQRVSPAVVQINVSSYGPLEEGDGRQVALLTVQRSTGSGVVVDAEGYIVTNAHVVRGALSVRVLLGAAGSEPVEASVVGVDRETDLAVIKVNQGGLPALPFGDSDALRQGDIVLAIGSPLGLRDSVSMGVVSAPARQIRDDSFMTYIQTDASINPGNSGGALVDSEGRLMGINSFILTQSGGSEGIGFAIPSSMVQSVYQQLRKRGHVHRGEIGAAVQDITSVLAAGLGLPRHSGVIVADVEPDGPSETAGIKQGDIVLSLEGRPVQSASEFEMAFYRRQKGEKVAVKLLRDGKESAITVEVDEVEQDDDFLASMVTPEKNLVGRLGILCIEIDRKLEKLVSGLRQAEGVVVAAKSSQGPGRYLDLQQGDVIHAINGMPVALLETFRASVNALKPGSPVVLLIERDAVYRYTAFEID